MVVLLKTTEGTNASTANQSEKKDGLLDHDSELLFQSGAGNPSPTGYP
jgi:hypothetical protein